MVLLSFAIALADCGVATNGEAIDGAFDSLDRRGMDDLRARGSKSVSIGLSLGVEIGPAEVRGRWRSTMLCDFFAST